MSSWNNNRNSDSYLDDDKLYEESALNNRFDAFVKKIGGKPRAILLLLGVFAVIITATAITLYTRPWQQEFANLYENYTQPRIFVNIVIGSLTAWLFCLITSFYREAIHEVTRPFQRVWAAEMQDIRLGMLGGKVSVFWLVIKFASVLIFAVVMMLMY